MVGARERLLNNILELLEPAAIERGLAVERGPGLPGFSATSAAFRDASGRSRLILAVYGSDPAPTLNLVPEVPAPHLLTAHSLVPFMELRIPAQLGHGPGAGVAAAQLPGTEFTPDDLWIETLEVPLRLRDAYAGVLELRPPVRRFTVEIELAVVSEQAVSAEQVRRRILQLVGAGHRRDMLTGPGEVLTRLAVSTQTENGPIGDPVVLVER